MQVNYVNYFNITYTFSQKIVIIFVNTPASLEKPILVDTQVYVLEFSTSLENSKDFLENIYSLFQNNVVLYLIQRHSMHFQGMIKQNSSVLNRQGCLLGVGPTMPRRVGGIVPYLVGTLVSHVEASKLIDAKEDGPSNRPLCVAWVVD